MARRAVFGEFEDVRLDACGDEHFGDALASVLKTPVSWLAVGKFYEPTDQYAQKVLDGADIVREAILRQQRKLYFQMPVMTDAVPSPESL